MLKIFFRVGLIGLFFGGTILVGCTRPNQQREASLATQTYGESFCLNDGQCRQYGIDAVCSVQFNPFDPSAGLGQCVCTEDLICSPNYCQSVATDSFNCGTCGNVCQSGKICKGGVCSCPHGTCGEKCVELATDSNNCGACGNKCPDFTPCKDGTCRYTCGQSINTPDPTPSQTPLTCGALPCVTNNQGYGQCGVMDNGCLSCVFVNLFECYQDAKGGQNSQTLLQCLVNAGDFTQFNHHYNCFGDRYDPGACENMWSEGGQSLEMTVGSSIDSPTQGDSTTTPGRARDCDICVRTKLSICLSKYPQNDHDSKHNALICFSSLFNDLDEFGNPAGCQDHCPGATLKMGKTDAYPCSGSNECYGGTCCRLKPNGKTGCASDRDADCCGSDDCPSL